VHLSERALPPAVQAAAMAVLTGASKRLIGRRTSRPPALGSPTLLTSVLRLPVVWSPPAGWFRGHHLYPAASIHVTVSSLDAGRRPLDEALADLRTRDLPAPTFTITGLGCSPATVFLRCLHDERYARLQSEVRGAFGLGVPCRPDRWLFHRLSYANVVRFDGTARWRDATVARQEITCRELQVVRTDRVLSEPATVVLASLSLTPEP
jgi:hypothetical protein